MSIEAYALTVRRRLSSNVFIIFFSMALGFILGCHEKSETVRIKEDFVRPVLSIAASSHAGPANGYSGKVEARYSTKLSFRLLGRIIIRQAHLGDMVSRKQVLATIDGIDLNLALQSAQASLAIAIAESDNAAVTFARQETLLSNNASSQADYDIAKQSLEAAKSAVEEAMAAVDRASENLGYTELQSDMDGVVTGVFAEVGETVAAGQVVFSVADPGQREVVIDVGEEMVSSLKIGSEFRILVPPLNNQCQGKVREIAPQADVATSTRRVRITLEDASEAFRIGSTIRAFPNFSVTEKISLPGTAILDRDGQTYVWVVDSPNKKVRQVQVDILDRNASKAVVASGISPGDQVVIAGVHSLTDGQTILVQSGAAL